jgi:atypical dual specificity phosphatase
VICWLIKYKRMSPEEAQQHLIRCRPHVNAKLLERPVVQQFIREQQVRPLL